MNLVLTLSVPLDRVLGDDTRTDRVNIAKDAATGIVTWDEVATPVKVVVERITDRNAQAKREEEIVARARQFAQEVGATDARISTRFDGIVHLLDDPNAQVQEPEVLRSGVTKETANRG